MHRSLYLLAAIAIAATVPAIAADPAPPAAGVSPEPSQFTSTGNGWALNNNIIRATATPNQEPVIFSRAGANNAPSISDADAMAQTSITLAPAVPAQPQSQPLSNATPDLQSIPTVLYGIPITGRRFFNRSIDPGITVGDPAFGHPVFGTPVIGHPVTGTPVIGHPIIGTSMTGGHHR